MNNPFPFRVNGIVFYEVIFMLKIMKKYEEALAECKMAKTKIACYRAWLNAYREALKQAKSDGLITDEVFMYICLSILAEIG